MQITEEVKELASRFENKSWFDSVIMDKNRLIAQVKEMNLSILNEIPTTFNGKQVLVHFAGSTKPPVVQVPLFADSKDILEELDDEDVLFDDKDLEKLSQEVDELVCSSNFNTVNDIFYEVHDGNNAVTNLSAKNPFIRSKVEELYNKYGFDILFEELDR